MANLQVAERYARALLSVAEETGVGDIVTRDLIAIGELIDKTPSLRAFLSHPLLGTAQQQRGLKAIFESRVDALVFRFLLFLAQKRRLSALASICACYATLDTDRRGILPARIVGAQLPDDTQVAAITSKLGDRYRKPLQPEIETDPSLLGGFIVHVGDTVHDFSIKGKLRSLKRHLAYT